MQLLLIVGGVRAGRLDEHVEWHLRLERVTNARPLGQHLDALLIKKLIGAQDLAQVLLRLLEQLEHALKVGARQEGDVFCDWHWWACDGKFGDDAERTLGTDDQLPQVGTGVVLPHLRERIHNCTVSHDELRAKDAAMQGAVTQQAKTPRVGGDVAADLTGALGAEVQRHPEPMLSELRIHLLEHAAGLARHNARVLVDVDDFAHLVRGDHNLIEHGHGAPNETGVAALRADR
mmetsp:Transcript_2987/g.7236  ORF Transcript_2987/g.7236 Transcript_2987/m.7236 type:complete len:233 (-) Transcript_2987:452-1150(-)